MQTFGCSEFHGLFAGNVHTALVAGSHYDEGGEKAGNAGHLNRGKGHALIAFFEQEPAAYADHKYGSGHPAARHGMEELDYGCGRKGYGHEIDHFVAHGHGVELHADGVLHPGVGHQNPPG